MTDIFSTREIATGIWLLILIGFVFISPSIRKSAINVIKAACSRKLVIPFITILMYATLFTLCLAQLPMWKNLFIKDIILWVLFAGVPVCYGAVNSKRDSHYFRKILTDNLKFSIIVEFIISSFTFNFLIEIIILPVLVFLAMMEAIAETKPEHQQVKKLISAILSAIGFFTFGLTLKMAIDTYSELGMVDLLISFFIPIVFSFVYIPIAYFFAVYAKYEIVFVRMSFKEPKNKKIQRKHRRKVFFACRLSYSKISLFEDYVYKMHVRMSDEEFNAIIDEFQCGQQHNPVNIN